MTNGVDPPVYLPLIKFGEAALLSTRDLQSCVEAVLPQSLSVYDIPVELITDDFSPMGLHKQLRNAECLRSISSKCWKEILEGGRDGRALFDKNGVIRTEVDRWLELYDSCYPRAASAMIIQAGGLDSTSFKHQRYDGARRTVFLLRNGLLLFVNPLISRRIEDRHLDMAVMPPDVSRCLLVLIVLLLPIANQLRQLKGQALPFCSTHLWTLPRRHTNGVSQWHYNSKDVNSHLIELTRRVFNVSLEGDIIRQMVQQLFSAEFPLLFSNVMHLRSPVDDQAQHTFATGLACYGRLLRFPPIEHLILIGDKPFRHLTACEIWQSLIKSAPIHDAWRYMVSGTVFFPTTTFPELAFQVARKSVLVLYGVAESDGLEDRKKLVQGIITAKPFLEGINVG